MLLSYIVGQRYYPISYPLKSIAAYVVLAALLATGIDYCNSHLSALCALGANTLLIGVFAAAVVKALRAKNKE